MKQAFLSYARADSEKAERLFKHLRRCLGPEVYVWFDRVDLLPGVRWDPAIRRAIRESDYFLAVLSNEAVSTRGFRLTELREAIEMSKEFPVDWIFLIPTRLDDCPMPFPDVEEFNYTDLFPEENWQKGVAQICRTIKAFAAGRGRLGPDGREKHVEIPRNKPRPRPDRKPRASRTPKPRISYKVGLLDLGSGVPTIDRIARGLNRVQSIFHFTRERVAAPRQALTAVRGQPQFYVPRLPKSFYKRIGLIETDYVICLSHRLLALEEGDYVYYNYLTYQSPDDSRVFFISYSELDEYAREADVTMDTAIAYLVTAELVDHFLDLNYHVQSRNCPMDFTKKLSEVVGGLRTGHFCRYCSRTLNNSKPFGEAFKAMIAWGR